MIHTFNDAGYQVKSAFDEGVMELVFRIDPTDTAIGVMEQREHRAEYASIERFFTPRSVAVIGASRRQDTIGRALVRHLVLGDFTGGVHVVNPSADSRGRHAGVEDRQDIPDAGRRRHRRGAGRRRRRTSCSTARPRVCTAWS